MGNYIYSDGITVDSNKRLLIINGVQMDMPKKMKGNSICTNGNSVYIDGFELKNGKWKRTIRAFWECYCWF